MSILAQEGLYIDKIKAQHLSSKNLQLGGEERGKEF